ncbi:MAG: MATE family efflux transporter, partial [Spirochaetales bacterium]|nr:MATE family efflux transporter [Spirochaetales bacterium]
RGISITFPFAAISIMMGALFQAMGDGYISMITSIVRQLFVLIPCAWLFGRLFGLDAVWYAWMAAEVVALTISVLFFFRELKKLNF